MRMRDRTLLGAMVAAAMALALVHVVTGVGADALIAVPALLLLLPLVAGRYVGAERLVRIVRRALPRERRRGGRPLLPVRPARRVVARGGLLIAVSLARRGPPASAAVR